MATILMGRAVSAHKKAAQIGAANGMGITFTKARISNPCQSRRSTVELEFLIDTGAIFSVVPGSIARKLGLEKLDREEFTLADGTRRTYDVSEAFFELGDRRGTSKVVFGPPNVTPLLGALTLESLGLMVNPVTREVSRRRLFLAPHSAGSGVD
ncbi:MAG: aspartyl protease family protein [Candidatus Binataceae bacterium]